MRFMNESVRLEKSEIQWLWNFDAGNEDGPPVVSGGKSPPPNRVDRAAEYMRLATGLRLEGRKIEAFEKLEGLFEDRSVPERIRRENYWIAIAFFHFLDRDLSAALSAARQLEDSGCSQGLYFVARASILRNEFNEARKRLEFLDSVSAGLDPRIAADSLCMLTMMYELSGRSAESAAAESALKEFARNRDDPAVAAVASSFQARLALTRGDIGSATHWMRTTDHDVGDGIMLWWFEAPRLTGCRVLVAEGAKSGLRKAVERLDAFEREIEALYCGVHLIEILCLSALAHEKLGFSKKARQLLARASTLAERDGVVLPFAESGAPIIDLVKRLREKKACGDMFQKIMADFSAEVSRDGDWLMSGARG